MSTISARTITLLLLDEPFTNCVNTQRGTTAGEREREHGGGGGGDKQSVVNILKCVGFAFSHKTIASDAQPQRLCTCIVCILNAPRSI